MIEARTLLAAALVVPLGMLLACLWPRALNRMPSLLAVRPDPGACRRVACRRRFSAGSRYSTPAPDFRPRSSRSRAARRCGAVVDHIRRLCFAISAGPPELRTIRGVLVDDPDRLRGHISGCRHGGLLFSSCAAHARRLRPRHQPRERAAHGGPALFMSGSRCWPKRSCSWLSCCSPRKSRAIAC